KSWNLAQSDPTSFAARAQWASSTSHTATNLTPGCFMACFMMPVPWPPTPIAPIVIVSLGPTRLPLAGSCSWTAATISRAYQRGRPAATSVPSEFSRKPRREMAACLMVLHSRRVVEVWMRCLWSFVPSRRLSLLGPGALWVFLPEAVEHLVGAVVALQL